MKKSFKIYAIIWAIAIITFNMISFIAPTEKIGSFWVGYRECKIKCVSRKERTYALSFYEEEQYWTIVNKVDK